MLKRKKLFKFWKFFEIYKLHADVICRRTMTPLKNYTMCKIVERERVL